MKSLRECLIEILLVLTHSLPLMVCSRSVRMSISKCASIMRVFLTTNCTLGVLCLAPCIHCHRDAGMGRMTVYCVRRNFPERTRGLRISCTGVQRCYPGFL